MASCLQQPRATRRTAIGGPHGLQVMARDSTENHPTRRGFLPYLDLQSSQRRLDSKPTRTRMHKLAPQSHTVDWHPSEQPLNHRFLRICILNSIAGSFLHVP
ncbi:hypothetical protein BCY86_02405 [Pajaroellobacter abortibovis]|uniref:Uncharacterized protein n=1 Tax=Pajaroellobacter abortibovis TaxID=1882918 RepID=A0A1L6MVU8_9BACT|nr:hypothetical protein BCY86_02405 [Pajaroellobacter abortibovis]